MKKLPRQRIAAIAAIVVLLGMFVSAVSARPSSLLTDGLISYWKLDEASGTRYDIVGSNDVSDNGDPFTDPGSNAGKMGQAADFDGASDWLRNNTTAPTSLQFNDQSFTISAWVYFDSFEGLYTPIVYKNNNEFFDVKFEYGLNYVVSVDTFSFFVSPDGTSGNIAYVTADAFGNPSIDTWYHVVGWYDYENDLLGIAVNNITNTVAYSGGVHADTSSLTFFSEIAAAYGDSNFGNGRLDGVGIWDRALSYVEISSLYCNGNGRDYPFTSCSSGGTATNTPSSPGGIPNWLRNGNFEQSFNGNWQIPEPFDGGENNYSSRVTGPSNPDYGGPAYCAAAYANINGEGIKQRFYWPGGTMYMQWRWRQKNNDFLTTLHPIVHIQKTDNPLYVAGAFGSLVPNSPPEAWRLYNDTSPLNMPAGTYDIQIYNSTGNWIDEVIVNPGTVLSYTIPAHWEREYDRERDFQIDDVFISQNSYYSHCFGGSTITPFPTPSRTVTRSRTPSPTATNIGANTATPSNTPAPQQEQIDNCNFEGGSVGWFGNFTVQLAGGPVGPQYARVNPGGTLSQSFTWSPSGTAYLTFYVGPGSYGEAAFRNTSTGARYVVWTGANNGSTWLLKSVTKAAMPTGTYNVEFVPYGNTVLTIDGVAVAHNGYAYCGDGTPTPGATSHVTATTTRTHTPGPSPTRTNTRTPTKTNTPNPAWTSTNTRTPQATVTASNTATITHTPANDSTATANAATATANASITPSAVPPTATATPEVPPQPEPAPNADCTRPADWWNVSAWIDYEVCVVLTWFVWTPANTDEISTWSESFNDYEPFGTIDEISDGLIYMRDTWQEAGWDGTGAACEVDAADLTNDASGILTGEFEIGPTKTEPYSPACELSIASFLGDALSSGMCFGVNILCQNGMLPWIQLVTNAGLVFLFINYLRSTWFVSAVH